MQEYDRRQVKASGLRIKEWDYYLVLGQGYGAAFTISDDGYIGLQSVSLLDFRRKWEHTETILNAFPMGKYHLPSNSGPGDTVYRDKRLEMDFIPVMDRAARMNVLVIETDQHQVFGRMSGRATLDDGTVIEIKDCLCFAEKVHNRY